MKGINRKKNRVQYPNVPSVRRPIPLGTHLPVHDRHGNLEYSSDSENMEITIVAGDDVYKQ